MQNRLYYLHTYFVGPLSHSLTRYLSGNPLQCSCENMWIKLWLGLDETENQELQCIDEGGIKSLSRLAPAACGKCYPTAIELFTAHDHHTQ